MNNASATTVEGIAVPYNPGDGSVCYYIGINKIAIDKANPSNSTSYVEGAFVDEIGHVFGLDDLQYSDSHIQIMSYYTDRNVLYTPQSGDIAGVNTLYK